MKKFFGHLVLISIFSFLAGLLYSLAQMTPQFKALLIAKIKKEVSTRTPVKIEIRDLHLSLFPPTASVEGLKVYPQEILKNTIHNLEFESIEAKVDPLQVLTGKVVINTINLKKPQASLNMKEWISSSSNSKDVDLQPFFDVLKKIPVSRLLISEASIELQGINDYQLRLQNFELMAFNLRRAMELWMTAPEILVSKNEKKIGLSLRGEVNFDAHDAQFSDVEIKHNTQELTFSGEIKEISKITSHPSGHLNLVSKINLEPLKDLVTFLNLSQWPHLRGRLQIESDLKIPTLEKLEAQFHVRAEDIQYEKLKFGTGQFRGHWTLDQVILSEAELQHPAGAAKAVDTVLKLDENYHFSTKVQVPNLDIKALMGSLDLPRVPANSQLHGELPCKGELKPQFFFTCEGEINGKDLLVYTPDDHKTIVALDQYSAKGTVTVNAQEVSYRADLKVGQSQGQSSGQISYNEGFKISYETPQLDFKDVKNLIDLKYEGTVSIKGTTEGNSQTATAEMDLLAKKFWFSDFELGTVKSHLLFQKGVLSFQKTSGQIGSSRYNGQVDVFVEKARLSADVDVPFFEVTDLLEVYSRKTQLPVVFTGAGSAKIKASGPFAFNRLSYEMNSVIFRGSAAGESFDRLQFNVSSHDGEVKITQASLQKNQGVVTASGVAHPNGDIEVQVTGSSFKLEESDLISRLGTNFLGLLHFRMSLTGYVLSPLTILKGSVTEASLDDQELPDSHFSLHIEKNLVQGQANIIGNRVRSEFTFPFVDEAPFHFQLETVDWNFTSFLSLLGSSSINREYQSALTSHIDLSSERGGFWKASGQARIDRLMLRRGSLSLANKIPIEGQMRNGAIDISNFTLNGDQNSLSLTGNNITAKNFAMNLAGKLNLHLTHIFMPFLEDIGGPITFSLKMNGPVQQPEILGTAVIEEGFTKIKGLVHPFERVNADILFSHSKIIINSLTGTLAGGSFGGDGSIEIKGLRNLPTQVKLHFDNVNLNIPDRIHTSGNGSLTFSGSWFPFLIAGSYVVQDGFVDKEFGDENGSSVNARQSHFLPRVLQESGFEPVMMDLHINLEQGIKIKNSQVEGDLKGNMDVKGPPSSPHLFGTVVVSNTSKLFLKDKIFDVKNATVKFTDPKENNPELFITATTRVNNYDINLVIQGTAKDPKIRMTSQPPLSDQDIVSLLALGITSERLDKDVESKQQAVQSASQIGTVILSQNPLNKQLQKSLGVDIQFSSKFDETRNTSVLKGTVSRKLSPKITASVGHAFGDQTTTDAKLIYEFNRNVSAIGSWESRDVQENSNYVGVENTATSVFGLDLEYKVEFK